MTLIILRVAGQIFCKMSLNWNLFDVCLLTRQTDNGFGGGRPQRKKNVIFITAYQGTYYQYDLSLLMLTSLTQCLSDFSTANFLISLFPYYSLQKIVTMRSQSIYINYLYFFYTEDLSILPSFIYLLNCLFQCECIDICCILGVIIPC